MNVHLDKKNTNNYSYSFNSMYDENMSKHIANPNDYKLVTEPNAVVIGGMKEIGVDRIKPARIPKLLLSHPAIERGIEFKFNRIITQLNKNDISSNIYTENEGRKFEN